MERCLVGRIRLASKVQNDKPLILCHPEFISGSQEHEILKLSWFIRGGEVFNIVSCQLVLESYQL